MMIKKLLVLSIALGFSATTTIANAKGNVSMGESQSASCTGCHGSDGNSTAPTFPKLAGQHAGYIAQQLQAFKNDKRNAPMMAPYALALDNNAIENISAYYATQNISSNQRPVLPVEYDKYDDEIEKTDEEKTAELNALITLGSDLYRNGNLKTKVSACIACHGPHGEGNKPASFPALQGQHADYLIKALSDFKQGKRSNVADNMMHMIAKKMSDEEIKALSYHISVMK